MLGQPRIIDVERKPRKCPVCGSSVVDIIYGTGDMNEAEFLLAYRMNAIMGGDIIPRRPPIWACSCGCKRFRKVYFDGTDVPVKVKMLKNIRPKPLTLIDFESTAVERALLGNHHEVIHHYKVDIVTELGEKETLSITAVSGSDAEDTAREIVAKGVIGLMGTECEQLEVFDNLDTSNIL